MSKTMGKRVWRLERTMKTTEQSHRGQHRGVWTSEEGCEAAEVTGSELDSRETPAGFRHPTLGGGQGWRLVRQLWEGGWGLDPGVRGHGFILGRRWKGHEGWEGQWAD